METHNFHTLPASRRRAAAVCTIVPLGIGFYGWQQFLLAGMTLGNKASQADGSTALKVLATLVTWGSPLWAFAVCALFIWAVWYVSAKMFFSKRRRITQVRLSIIAYVSGFALSMGGLMMNIADIPPIDALYKPVLKAIDGIPTQ